MTVKHVVEIISSVITQAVMSQSHRSVTVAVMIILASNQLNETGKIALPHSPNHRPADNLAP